MKRLYVLSIIFLMGGFVLNGQVKEDHHVFVDSYGNGDQYRSEISIPDILGYKTLKCDLHAHTIFSDGTVLPQVRIQEAWRQGLDVIALTDHDSPLNPYLKGDHNTPYLLAKPTADRLGIILVKGIEYTRNKPIGHINFLFVDDAEVYMKNKDWTPEQAVDYAAKSGAFVTYNHPGWPDKNSDLFDFQINMMRQKKMHGIEIFNSTEFYPVAVQYCKQYDVTPISATDVHSPIDVDYQYSRFLRNMTLVFADDHTEESLKKALFEKRTVAYAQNMLAGESKYIFELFRASLDIVDYREDEYSFSCKIHNRSDIDYHLRNFSGKVIMMPAHKTTLLSEPINEKIEVYQVINTYTDVNQHLPVTLDMLQSGNDRCNMPFVNQNLIMIDKTTKITIVSPTDGAAVYYTLDGSEPTESSNKYEKPFTVSNSGQLKIRAYKNGMKPSSVFRKQIILSHLHPAVKANPKNNGLEYAYYEGNFERVSEITQKGKFVKKGFCDQPDLDFAEVEDHFGLIFKGYIYAPVSGIYEFATYSDDGSVLFLDGIEVVNNDGSHSLTKVSQSIALEKGYHQFELKYLEDFEDQNLTVFWTIPGKKEEEISKNNYYR